MNQKLNADELYQTINGLIFYYQPEIKKPAERYKEERSTTLQILIFCSWILISSVFCVKYVFSV